MDEVAIKVTGITKRFKIPHEKHSSLKANAIHLFSKKGYTEFNAVDDISFEIKKGEFFGIVGRNGSGKSTLLKLLAQIYVPTSGEAFVNGSLSPFIELGVGFSPELTARENVFLNGAILGLSRAQLEEKFDDIIGFAELEKFVDQKLKNFSSGMQVRLAFSIAIQAQADILLMDEVLAVGDANFQQKCFDVFLDLKRQGKTIVLVTHDMSAINQFCDRAIMVENGKVIASGKPHEISEKYLLANYEAGSGKEKKEDAFKNIRVTTPEGKTANYFKPQESFTLHFDYQHNRKKPSHLGLQIFNQNDVLCFGTNSLVNDAGPYAKTGPVEITFTPNLQGGNYFIALAVLDESATQIFDFYPRVTSFRIAKADKNDGITVFKQSWKGKA